MKALVFDFDGLILDTELPEYQSWQKIYQDRQVELPFEMWAQTIGTHGVFDPYDYLEKQLGEKVDRERLSIERRKFCHDILESKTVLPGVEAYIAEARRLGMKLGVASSSSREWVVGHLERLGLLDRFDCIRSRTDVKHVKPDPELYLAALACLDVSPAEALALEDSPNGILAAKAAGMYCVAVPNSLTSQLPLGAPDLRLNSMAERPLTDVIQELESVGQKV